MRKDELAGQPQAFVPTEERTEGYATGRLGSSARLIPTIAFDWSVAQRTAVYITASSPTETAVRADYMATALKCPRPIECSARATVRTRAPVPAKKTIGRQESAFSGKTKQGTTLLVVGISCIALALLLGRLSLVSDFFGGPNSYFLNPPNSAIGGAPPGPEPVSWEGIQSTGDETVAAPNPIVPGAVQESLAAIPPALPDASPRVPIAIPPGSAATDPLRPDEEALAPTAIPSGSETARHDENLPAPSAIPSEPASATLSQATASGILDTAVHQAQQVGHDRHGTAADSGRRPQRDTNIIKSQTGTSLQASLAYARRRSALPEWCQATQDGTRCVPVRRVRARSPPSHGVAATRPSRLPWNSAPARFP
jgi:hypothetical protein